MSVGGTAVGGIVIARSLLEARECPIESPVLSTVDVRFHHEGSVASPRLDVGKPSIFGTPAESTTEDQELSWFEMGNGGGKLEEAVSTVFLLSTARRISKLRLFAIFLGAGEVESFGVDISRGTSKLTLRFVGEYGFGNLDGLERGVVGDAVLKALVTPFTSSSEMTGGDTWG